MAKKGAELISYALHPLLLATLLMLVLFFFAPNVLRPIDQNNVIGIMAFVFALTFLIPILSVGMLKLTGSVSSMKLENRKERIMPFTFIALYYALAVYLFTYKIVLSQITIVVFTSTTALIFLVTIITSFYKISIHSTGIFGMLGFMVAIHMKYPDSKLFWPIIVVLLLAGMVNSARLFLRVHSPGQVSLGSLLGFVISFASIYLFA